MPKPIAHTRITEIPDAELLQGGRLDSLRIEKHGLRRDLVMDFQGFKPTSPSLLLVEQEILYERLEGTFMPRRLRFTGVKELSMHGMFENLDSVPVTHEVRTIRDLFAFQPVGEKLIFYLLMHSAPDQADLRFFARTVTEEPRTGKRESITFVRDWCPPPAMPGRLVPDTKHIYAQFGGDPISVKLHGEFHHQKLFLGGLEKQSEERPHVDAVLNLGEEPSRWVKSKKIDSRDRWVRKGEGSDGMSMDEITEEALWVIERLKTGGRVLVHCVAGMNRSPTVCCAVLMLMEGLSAEEALVRIRRNHPWARPDTHHWLKLRWLASTLR